MYWLTHQGLDVPATLRVAMTAKIMRGAILLSRCLFEVRKKVTVVVVAQHRKEEACQTANKEMHTK